ncbi:hypothetical protein ABKN59_000284 [Abortiporus biennis]
MAAARLRRGKEHHDSKINMWLHLLLDGIMPEIKSDLLNRLHSSDTRLLGGVEGFLSILGVSLLLLYQHYIVPYFFGKPKSSRLEVNPYSIQSLARVGNVKC